MPKSLKTRLILTLLVSLSAAWIATLAAGYLLTERTLNRQLDDELRQTAETLSTEPTTNETTLEVHARGHFAGNGNGSVEFQIWHEDKMVRYSEHAPKESLSPTEGFSQNEIGPKRWRVFSSEKDGSRILVGQDLDIRRNLIHGMMASGLWPMALALPLIALLLWFSVTLGLRPLSALAAAIRERAPGRLSEIALEGVPEEVTPVVHSLNSLLAVVDRALEREKEFANDAAHELRTPLAGVKAQAAAALRSIDEKERTRALTLINEGVDRASRIVDQLLDLARLEPASLETTFTPVNLRTLVAQSIAKWTPAALAKEIDLGLREGGESASIIGDPASLELLVSNLIDNAIKYSPKGGEIDIALRHMDSEIILSIEDQGPGIPPADRDRVFDRFVRLPGNTSEGSGIGLAVVKKIVALHHARIELAAPDTRPGLRVTVIFPNPPTPTAPPRE